MRRRRFGFSGIMFVFAGSNLEIIILELLRGGPLEKWFYARIFFGCCGMWYDNKKQICLYCILFKNYWMRLSRISELFRPRSALSAKAKLRQITLTKVWIILISCDKPNSVILLLLILQEKHQFGYRKTGQNKQQLVNFQFYPIHNAVLCWSHF